MSPNWTPFGWEGCMEDSKWERYAVLGGFVFVVLNVVGAFLPGAPPATDDSADKIAKYFSDNAGKIQTAQVLLLIGVIGLVWWFGTLFRKMRAAEGGDPRISVVALVGLALGGGSAMMSGVFTSAAALRHDDLGEGTRVFFTLGSVTLASAAVGVVIFVSAVTALNLRATMFPSWTNFVGWIVSGLFTISILGAGSDSNAFALIGLFGFLSWCVWIVIVSLNMWKGTEAATS